MQLVGQKIVYQGWGRFLLLTVKLADGAVVSRQMEDHGCASSVLPYDAERRLALMARMPRPGPLFNGEDPTMLEACAGIIDPGETAAVCARREALEELGVKLTHLEPVARAYTAPGVCSEAISLYLAPFAAADRIETGGGLAAENEEIELPLAELARQVDDGEIRDLKTLALIQTLRVRRPDLFV